MGNTTRHIVNRAYGGSAAALQDARNARTADGKPDLTAPVPRTPNLSGPWRGDSPCISPC